MKKLLPLFFALFIAYQTTLAEDFPYGTYKLEDMQMKSYTKDATAHALVLQEFGRTWISSRDGLPLIHEYHVKIKIFDSKAFNEGNVAIRLYKNDNNSFEKVRDIEGVTFYTDDQDQIQSTALDSKKVIIENRNKYWDIAKFDMPNLRDGCVIEYKYTVESPRTLSFKDWDFQSGIPKLYSEYEAHIPGFFNYKVSLTGPYKLTQNKAELETGCFEIRGNKCDCSKMTYGISNIPAFIEEDYMTAPKNFLSAISFELNDYIDPYDGVKHIKTQTWADIDRSLKQHDEFGGQLRKTGLFKEKIPVITTGLTDDLSRAKAIYTYLQKNMKLNQFYGMYTDNGVRKALETHSGNVGDINIALVAALNAAGINTEAVVLSTRDNGIINKLYPVASEFNYVIAKANIADKSYLLDATDPMLPFGLLPEHCINDQGRVMSLNKPSYWIDLSASQKQSQTQFMDLTLQPDGKLKGKILFYSNGYQALKKRRSIKKFNSVDEFVENMDEKMPRIKILKWDIRNLDTIDVALSETYEVEINLFDNANASRLSFNPFFLNRLTENPFKLAERTYPVDMGAPEDSKVVLNIHLPQDYQLEVPPQNVGVQLPNQGGKFVTVYDMQENMLSFSHIIQLNKSIYSSEEYPYLKELYNKIIQTQKADIIFKKK